MRMFVLLLALGAGACTETPRQAEARLKTETRTNAALDRELVGRVAGPPQTCISAADRREMKAFGELLVFQGTGGVRYVTQTSGCLDVGGENILVTQTPTSQLCRGDIATTVNRTARVPSGSCSFGDFVPYRKAGPDRL